MQSTVTLTGVPYERHERPSFRTFLSIDPPYVTIQRKAAIEPCHVTMVREANLLTIDGVEHQTTCIYLSGGVAVTVLGDLATVVAELQS